MDDTDFDWQLWAEDAIVRRIDRELELLKVLED